MNRFEPPLIVWVLCGLATALAIFVPPFCALTSEPKPTENVENTVEMESGLKLVRTEYEIEALLRTGDEHPDSAAVYEDIETRRRYLIVTTHHGGVSVTLLEPAGQEAGE